MPAGTYTFTMQRISGSANGTFTVLETFTVTIYDADDNFGVGDDQPSTETGSLPVIQSIDGNAPAGWAVGQTFVFGGARGIESGSEADDYLVPKVNGSFTTGDAVYSLPDASTPLVVGQSYSRDGGSSNVDREVQGDVPCFVAGTMIATQKGEVAVENLREGDMVLTRDAGYQPVRWIAGRRVMTTRATAPIVFEAGVLGAHRRLKVSPNHRMLISAAEAELYFGETEILVPAKHLKVLENVYQEAPGLTTYYHFLFDQHQIVFSNGALTESFLPGPAAMDGLADETRDELLGLFPELAEAPWQTPVSARTCIRAFEQPVLEMILERRQ
ncbi:Hint domain-containing protein [Roseovarius sp. C7]|uniref:Hint domain-containing protein n=1 Tax=Roseovarius sp. C7 TaxID=3398643 RepID=UPI0039F6796A